MERIMKFVLQLFFYFAAVVCASLTDAIDHGKGAEPLYDLWHLSRNMTWLFVFLIGRSLSLQFPFYVYLITGVCGMMLWEALYKIFIKRAPAWDNKFKIPFGRWLTWLGFGRGPAYN
jgi:hypothetical protein